MSPVLAQEITIQAIDGSVSIRGELTSYDGEFYVLKTRIGEVALTASEVICLGDACPQNAQEITQDIAFTIAGSNSIGLDLMPELMAEFALNNDFLLTESVSLQIGEAALPNQTQYVFENNAGEIIADVSIESNGADSAFGALLDGSAQIVMSSRAVRASEVEAFMAVGLGDISTPENQTIVALDGLIIVVSRENPVVALSLSEIASIFAGDIVNWQELGGPDQAINLYRRAADAGITSEFQTNVLAPRQMDFSGTATIFQTDAEISGQIAQDPFGIGFVSFAFENNARAVALRDTCGFPIYPTEFSIKTGEYPLSRQLFLYTLNRQYSGVSVARSGQIQNFLTFVQSDIAQNAVRDAGFVSQSIVGLSIDAQGQRLANALSVDAPFEELRNLTLELRNADRLSTTFRILDDNPVIDNGSAQRIARLANFLGSKELTGKEVVFAGFTSSLGDTADNNEIALARANRTINLLRDKMGAAADGLNLVAIGFGEAAPLACNDSVFGRAINQRVEVWIRDSITN